MTARPIRRNAQTPDRNGKIFYTSTTSLSHISKSLPFVTKGYIYVINQMLAQNKIEILLFLYVKKKKAVIQQPSSRYKMYIYFYSA